MIPISKPYIGEEEQQAVLEVLKSGMLVQGPKVKRLEEAWARVCGVQHAIATANGTTALHTALIAHGIGTNDEVVTTSFTFMASINSILYVGAKPVFVDILPCCFNMNVDALEAAVTPRTKAIMAVHLYGYPCYMDRIMDVAQRHGLVVIEDAAQAIGATYKDKPVGGFGTGCFSLYATKNVMSAEGGMITTNDDEIARKCRMIRAHGMERRYYHDMLGYNFRMTDLHAAIGITQLDRLDKFTAKRRANAAFLNSAIKHPNVINPGGQCVLAQQPDVGHVWHQYTIRIVDMDRDVAVQKLNKAGVGTGIFYPVPAHRQKHLHAMGYDRVSLPITEQIAREVISLPVHPMLNQDELHRIAEAVNSL